MSEPVTIPRELYDELLEYFTDREDIRDGEHGPRPNRAMVLATQLREAESEHDAIARERAADDRFEEMKIERAIAS